MCEIKREVRKGKKGEQTEERERRGNGKEEMKGEKG